MAAVAERVEMRDVILDAAEALMARYGYRKMTMDDLAREAGIGKGTTYLYFRSKEEVGLGTVDRIIERLLDELRRIAAGPGSPVRRLRAMLRARVLFRFDGVQRYTESLDELLASVRAGLLARRVRHFEEEAALLAEVLEEGRRAGLFRFAGATRAARTLILATNSLLPYSLTPRELGAREDVEDEVSRIADLLIAGLQSAGDLESEVEARPRVAPGTLKDRRLEGDDDGRS